MSPTQTGQWEAVGTKSGPPRMSRATKRAIRARNEPFWGPRRSSEGPGCPDLVPTASHWPVWVGVMVTTHFDLVSAPSGPPGTLKGPVSARNAPFGVLGGSRGARFGPDCPRLVRLGWTHAHHTLCLGIGPLLGPRGAKKGYLALIPKFPRPNFVRDIFFFKYRLVGCPEHRSGMPYSSSTVIAHLEPPSSRKRSKTDKKGPFGPQNTLLVLHVIELYSNVLYGIACYFIVLHGTE